jgi:hypothetical protein
VFGGKGASGAESAMDTESAVTTESVCSGVSDSDGMLVVRTAVVLIPAGVRA